MYRFNNSIVPQAHNLIGFNVPLFQIIQSSSSSAIIWFPRFYRVPGVLEFYNFIFQIFHDSIDSAAVALCSLLLLSGFTMTSTEGLTATCAAAFGLS